MRLSLGDVVGVLVVHGVRALPREVRHEQQRVQRVPCVPKRACEHRRRAVGREGGADGAGERCRDAVGSDLAPLRPGHPPRRGHACGLIIYSENATAPFVWEVGERDDREGEEAGRRAPSR